MSNSNELPTQQLYATTRNYFGIQWGLFWRWAEAGEVLEWQEAELGTIAYRAELAKLLRNLADQDQGLPPLAAVLLLLAACADSWPEQGKQEEFIRALPSRMFTADDDPVPEQLDWHLRHVSQFMDVVRALPANLRTGPARLHLLREVCSAQVPQVAAEWAGTVLDEWQSGRQDEWLTQRAERYARRALLRDTSCLVDTYNRFPSTELLTQHLRTGLSHLPALLAALPQPPPAPEPAPDDLLTQLGQDARTAGLAQLARHLLAGLRVPDRAEGPGERPLGGVADLTNRGPLDRLLLSELAHDDLTLTARLANHEALYLRREEPPLPAAQPTTILLDTTLRLWGTPRVFGLAAALAWAQQAGQRPATARGPVRAFALGGQAATPLELSTLPGVVAALSLLDPAPHCGAALLALGPAAGGVLITEAELVHQSADFARLLADNTPGLRFLLTVARDGTLALHEWASGHRRLVGTTQYDLAALLAAAPANPSGPLAPGRAEEPAFWQQPPVPLFLPATALRLSGLNLFFSPELGALAVTGHQRLLHWPSRHTGARELLPIIESGAYCFGTDGTSYAAVLVARADLARVYKVELATGQVRVFDLTSELGEQVQELGLAFVSPCFYVRWPSGIFAFDCQQEQVGSRQGTVVPPGALHLRSSELPAAKHFINNGYNVLSRVRHLGISPKGELVIEGHELRVVGDVATLTHSLRLLNNHPTLNQTYQTCAVLAAGSIPTAANSRVVLRRFTWPDGSTSLLDGRGLLHLRSADPAVPEVTVVLVLNQPTAAWAADGTVCGSDYFTGPAPTRRLPAPEFYQRYLQP
ncbi:MAG: hypothetical protein EOO59_05695, partial [Hymenobacter sp.]